MLKKAINYILFSGLSAGIGFLTIIYMTRSITPEEFGVVGLFMAILYVLPQLISFSTIGLVSINKVKLNQRKFLEFSNKNMSFSIFVFLIIFILSTLVGFIVDKSIYLFIFIPIIAFIQYFSMFHNAELIQDGRSSQFGVYRLILSIFSLILTVIFISYFQLSWDGRLFAILLSESIIVIIMLIYTFHTLKEFKFIYSKLDFKEYVYFGFPLLFGLGAGWLLNQADRFIVLHYFTLKDVGIYTVAYSIGTIINMINQAATNAIVPTLYEKLEKKEGHKIVKKLNIYYSIVILSLSLFIGITSYWYVPLLFGMEYASSSDIILFISLAFAFNGIYRTTGSVIAFYKKNKLQMNILYISAIINIVLSVVFIPIFGILSPAIATMIAYIVLALISYRYGWKILKKEEQC
jgi:O-antigen/teichoic acid export membrane protein